MRKDCMIHKFRGQEVQADLLHNIGQRIASACGGNGPYNFSLAQVAFPKKHPPLIGDLKRQRNLLLCVVCSDG